MIGDVPGTIALIQDAIRAGTEQVNTCLPGKVLAYDAEKQTARVRIVLKRPVRTDDEGTDSETVPDLPCVPVVFPRAGDFVFHLPLAAGDGVLVLFPQWNTSEWHRTGEDETDPCDLEHHGMGSAVCIAGLFPATAPAPGLSAAEMLLGKHDGPAVRVTSSKVTVGNNANPVKQAARKGDSVKVTITPEAAALILAPPGMAGGPCSAAGPIELTGTIQSGSAVVDISD